MTGSTRPRRSAAPLRTERRLSLAAPPPDPFREHGRAAFRKRLQLLGGRFEFETDSARLMHLVQLAYARMPRHVLSRTAPPRYRIRLVLTRSKRATNRHYAEPPPVRPLSGAGMLCGAMGGASFVVLSAPQRAALIVVSEDLLRYAYHIRYELLEFAVYVLAARVQRLVPLHAACVGRAGEGVLLVGSSGVGKSTVVLHWLLEGQDLLAEDSVLVRPQDLCATGVSNFLHLRRDSLRFLDPAARSRLLRGSHRIRRRSGVEKLEIDLRRSACRLAPEPLRIRAVAYLSRRAAGAGPLLRPLRSSAARRRLISTQRYAANQPGWARFAEQCAKLPAYELRRGTHPREAVEALRELLSVRLEARGARQR